ncbi:DUF4376 domain-containing protein [Gemmobacter nectariphilus]|uniref:DUF4376 domain-containing protein n=1 Tax=Gemmobacter nectariphilus TaxID=220343 RepID=UPI000407DB90|nr:DUF4376 domain-containing protein [Gemmobacter nectariphilus]
MTIAIDLSQLITAEAKAAEAAAARRAAVKARRDVAIASGITVGGVSVATDDQSQSRVMGAAVAAMLDPGYSVQWKTASGFVTLSAPQVIGLATAIRAHVQACFDREAVLLADLEAGGTVDIDTGWP